MSTKYKEELVKKDIEEITSDTDDAKSQGKLDSYKKILHKGDNINIKLTEGKIKLLKSSSFAKICAMASVYQEESIVFTLYIKEEEESSKANDSTKEDTVIYIRSKFKQSTIEKVDSSVSKCPKFYHKVWYCLYPFHIIAAIAAFVHIGLYYSKNGLTTQPVECMNICLGLLLLFGGILGLVQVNKKQLTSFACVNAIIVFGMMFDIGCMVLPNFKEICGETMFNYLDGYMLIVYIVYGAVLALQLITIVINISITSFYEKYAKEEKEEGLLLVEMK